MNSTTFADRVDTYEAALMSLFSGKPEETEADLSRLFTPSFTLRYGSEELDFPAFVVHIRHLREILPKVTLTVTQFLRDGKQLAGRHSSSTTLSDGSVKNAETFLFANIADDGRFSWIVESVVSKP